MIIVEGTDKSGKTTLISQLVKIIDTKDIVHFGLLPENWDYCEDYLRYIKPNIIFDRFIDSELVYGPTYRSRINPRLTKENIVSIYKKCLQNASILIYCNPSEQIVFKRIEKEGDELIKKIEQLKELRKRFDELFHNNYPLDIIELDTSSPIKPEILKNIVKQHSVLRNTSLALDQRNYRGFIHPHMKYLFYTSDYDEKLITEILLDKEISLRDFGIVNSKNTRNEPVNINNITNLTKISQVITIGKQSIEDYKKSGSSIKPIECKNLRDLILLK